MWRHRRELGRSELWVFIVAQTALRLPVRWLARSSALPALCPLATLGCAQTGAAPQFDGMAARMGGGVLAMPLETLLAALPPMSMTAQERAGAGAEHRGPARARHRRAHHRIRLKRGAPAAAKAACARPTPRGLRAKGRAARAADQAASRGGRGGGHGAMAKARKQLTPARREDPNGGTQPRRDGGRTHARGLSVRCLCSWALRREEVSQHSPGQAVRPVSVWIDAPKRARIRAESPRSMAARACDWRRRASASMSASVGVMLVCVMALCETRGLRSFCLGAAVSPRLSLETT